MLPFTEYHIATSHNSYLRRLQILPICCYGCAGKPSVNLIRSLDLGARMIELDIHQTNDGKRVVVSHARHVVDFTLFGSERQDLEEVLETLVGWLDVHHRFSPVILDLEIGRLTDENLNYVADVIYSNLSKYILPGKMNFRTMYPEEFLGKVILMAGSGLNDRLSNIINVNKIGDWWIKNLSIPDDQSGLNELVEWTGGMGGFARCYPSNIVLSRNFNPEPLLKAGVNCVAMNYGFNDRHLQTYIKFFSSSTSGLTGYRLKSQTTSESKYKV